MRKITLDLANQVSLVDRDQLARWLDDGTARAKMDELVECQGGRARDLEVFSSLHVAPVIREIASPASGVVGKVDAETVGRASLALGAGRGRAGDSIDFSVGFDQIVKVGTQVEAGEVIGRVHASSESAAEAAMIRFKEGFVCES